MGATEGQQRGIEDFTYDELDRVTRITQGGNGVAQKRVDFDYDAASQMTSASRYADLAGTQLVAGSDYAYDLAGRLTNLTHGNETNVLADYAWVYDAASRITQFSSPDGVSEYSYDDRNQLTGTDHSYQGDEDYSYDDNGNRTNEGYQTGDNNRLLSDGTYTYEYDAEGNRTRRTEIATGEVTEYSWDYRNRLTSVVTTDNTGQVIASAEYTYDVYDRRIEKRVDEDGDEPNEAQVERFVYDGDHIALVFDGEGNQTERYLHGPQIDQVLAEETADGQVRWALADNQGTVRDVVDNEGQILNHISYDSFGNVTEQSNPEAYFRFGYTGREFDQETGQYYYRARYFDTGVGRFISEDPLGFGGLDTNLSRYVFNNPIGFTDPTGLLVLEGAATTTAGGAATTAGGLTLSGLLAPVGLAFAFVLGTAEPTGDLSVEGNPNGLGEPKRNSDRKLGRDLELEDEYQSINGIDTKDCDCPFGGVADVEVKIGIKSDFTPVQKREANAMIDSLNRLAQEGNLITKTDCRGALPPRPNNSKAKKIYENEHGEGSARRDFEAKFGKTEDEIDVDHIRPTSFFGTDELRNLTPRTSSVNKSIGPRLAGQAKKVAREQLGTQRNIVIKVNGVSKK